MSKRILITGSEGFTGQYVVNEFKLAGYEVYGTGSRHANPIDYQYYQAKLSDKNAIIKLLSEVKPNLIIHLAALAFIGTDEKESYYDTNLIGTLNLLEAVSKSNINVDKILLSSSANVYGNQSSGILNEENICLPENHYAASKLAMEYMAKIWMSQLPIIITRPFNYTGKGQAEHFLIPKIIAHFKEKSEVIELGNINIWRDFNDVRTIAYVYRQLIELGNVSEVYNVGSGRMYSLKEIILLCEKITGHSIEVKINPQFIRYNEVDKLCADTTKLEKCIGSFNKHSFKKTLEWLLL